MVVDKVYEELYFKRRTIVIFRNTNLQDKVIVYIEKKLQNISKKMTVVMKIIFKYEVISSEDSPFTRSEI